MIQDEDVQPLVEVIGWRSAGRRIALALRGGQHHVVGCSGPRAILSTTAALYSVPAVHYLGDGHAVTMAANPLSDELREGIRAGGTRWSVSLLPTASMTTAVLAGRLGCTPAPDTSPAVFHRRPEQFPDRAPPLLATAQRRLAAYLSSTRPRPERPRP